MKPSPIKKLKRVYLRRIKEAEARMAVYADTMKAYSRRNRCKLYKDALWGHRTEVYSIELLRSLIKLHCEESKSGK